MKNSWSVVHLDGSERGRYCGEFVPSDEAMKLEEVNQMWNVCHQGALAIGIKAGGMAIYGSSKSRLAEFKVI